MFRRILRLVFLAAVVSGASFALVKFVQSRRGPAGLPSGTDWLPPKRPEKPLVEPEMLHGVALRKETEAPAWVEPEGGGACPPGYPIKGKLSSGIFHLPGMLAYERTTPDRCYADEAAAEADGLRKAKR